MVVPCLIWWWVGECFAQWVCDVLLVRARRLIWWQVGGWLFVVIRVFLGGRCVVASMLFWWRRWWFVVSVSGSLAVACWEEIVASRASGAARVLMCFVDCVCGVW